MHPILEAIYATQTVTDGTTTYSGLNAKGQATYLDAAEGELLQRVIARVQPTTTLEVGMAYGISSLFICDALSRLVHPAEHIAIDPNQHTKWRAIGLHNLRAGGFEGMLRFFEERSEFCLPRLVEQGTAVQVALIDGLHLFDQCAVEFYYIDRMLPVGGVVVFDDVDWPAIHRVVRLALSLDTYKVSDHTGIRADRPSMLGRARRALARVPKAKDIFKQDFLVRDWDLQLAGSCVALEKISSRRRAHGDYKEF